MPYLSLKSSSKKLKLYELEILNNYWQTVCVYEGEFPPSIGEHLFADDAHQYTVISTEKIGDARFELKLETELSLKKDKKRIVPGTTIEEIIPLPELQSDTGTKEENDPPPPEEASPKEAKDQHEIEQLSDMLHREQIRVEELEKKLEFNSIQSKESEEIERLKRKLVEEGIQIQKLKQKLDSAPTENTLLELQRIQQDLKEERAKKEDLEKKVRELMSETSKLERENKITIKNLSDQLKHIQSPQPTEKKTVPPTKPSSGSLIELFGTEPQAPQDQSTSFNDSLAIDLQRQIEEMKEKLSQMSSKDEFDDQESEDAFFPEENEALHDKVFVKKRRRRKRK